MVAEVDHCRTLSSRSLEELRRQRRLPDAVRASNVEHRQASPATCMSSLGTGQTGGRVRWAGASARAKGTVAPTCGQALVCAHQ